MNVEGATAGDGYPVREGTLVVNDTTGDYGCVVALTLADGVIMAAVACQDEALRSFDVEELSVMTGQGG